MTDTSPIDFTTPLGKVRNYIPDTDLLADPLDPNAVPSYLFSDEEVQAFIDAEVVDTTLPVQSFQLHRAAGWAMIAIGNNENLVLKKIKTQDQTTDGAAVAKQFIAAAAAAFARADEEEKIYRLTTVFAEGLDTAFPHQTHAPNGAFPWDWPHRHYYDPSNPYTYGWGGY